MDSLINWVLFTQNRMFLTVTKFSIYFADQIIPNLFLYQLNIFRLGRTVVSSLFTFPHKLFTISVGVWVASICNLKFGHMPLLFIKIVEVYIDSLLLMVETIVLSFKKTWYQHQTHEKLLSHFTCCWHSVVFLFWEIYGTRYSTTQQLCTQSPQNFLNTF